MPEWLLEGVRSDAGLAPQTVATRLLASLAAGLVVAATCYAAHGRRKSDSPMLLTTLVLLTVLITMVTLVIGDSVARAFGLVGALSIVRFRTVVEDTRDTAFVIFAVIVGMAFGAGLPLVPLVGIPIVGLAAVALDRLGQASRGGAAMENILNVRLSLGRDPEALLGETLRRHAERLQITAAGTARQGAAMDVTYRFGLRSASSMTTLVAELNQIEGVQSVELRRA